MAEVLTVKSLCGWGGGGWVDSNASLGHSNRQVWLWQFDTLSTEIEFEVGLAQPLLVS